MKKFDGRKGLLNLTCISEHSSPWYFFDVGYYVEQCVLAGRSPPLGSDLQILKHYIERGSGLGFSPNRLFDEQYYRNRYPDVAREIESRRWKSGFEHFALVGASEDFSPSWIFDGLFYRSKNSDITEANLNFGGFQETFSHYLLVGLSEHRPGNWLTEGLATCRKTALSEISSLDSLQDTLSLPDKLHPFLAPIINLEWIAERYDLGVKAEPTTVLQYYLRLADSARLSPSPYFEEAFYRLRYPEIDEAVSQREFSCGYEHYLLHGMLEWRDPLPNFDVRFYYDRHLKKLESSGIIQIPWLHFLRNRSTARLALQRPISELDVPEAHGKAIYERRCEVHAELLQQIELLPSAMPDISVIIIVRNSWHQTANCILSVWLGTKRSVEFVIFDNGSTDDTILIPQNLPSLKYIRSEVNIGFTLAVNKAAQICGGTYILLLNNDLEIGPGAIDEAVVSLQRDDSVGAVGARIVRMHGRLQEGGSIIWSDGTCLGYYRDNDANAGQVNFARPVDFCSGCFLLLSRDLWNTLGGFDEAFAPAYYEETDLCVRIWDLGKSILYNPRCLVWHFEYGSSSIREEPLTLMRRNQRYFARKHRQFLSSCLQPDIRSVERARLRHMPQPRILFIEDSIPDAMRGAGFTRSSTVLRVLASEVGLVSVLGLHNQTWPAALGTADGGKIEILSHVNILNIVEFLRERIGVYDLVWLSRTHNLGHLKSWKQTCPDFFRIMPIVLDTEAVASARIGHYARLAVTKFELEKALDLEFANLEDVTQICAVNEIDAAYINGVIERFSLEVPVSILGHSINCQFEEARLEDRHQLVLSGSFSEFDGPNADAVLWFDREVMPRLSLPPSVRVTIAGFNAAQFVEVAGLLHQYDVIDSPKSMDLVYSSAIAVLAPTRFAAGIPMKVHEAAAWGVPVVMSQLLAEQLSWTDDALCVAPLDGGAFSDIITLLCTDIAFWHQARETQLKLVQRDCDPSRFRAQIRRILKG